MAKVCVAAAPPKSQLETRQAYNKGTAQVVPVILIGIVGYTTWVIIVLLCGTHCFRPVRPITPLILCAAHYLLHPPSNVARRTGVGIAIIVVYFVLLIPAAITYFRLLGTVRDPGYVPKGVPGDSTTIKHEKEQETSVTRSCTTTKVPANDDSNSQSRSTSEKPGVGVHGQAIWTLKEKK